MQRVTTKISFGILATLNASRQADKSYKPVTSNGGNVLIARVPCNSIDPAFVVTENLDLLVLDSVKDDGGVVC